MKIKCPNCGSKNVVCEAEADIRFIVDDYGKIEIISDWEILPKILKIIMLFTGVNVRSATKFLCMTRKLRKMIKVLFAGRK